MYARSLKRMHEAHFHYLNKHRTKPAQKLSPHKTDASAWSPTACSERKQWSLIYKSNQS